MTTLKREVPRKLLPLLQPARYKGAHGGRGGAKSHFFAEQVILRMYERPTRIACIREVQNTIRDSVRQLLIDKIQKFNLGHFFQVLETEIRAANGGHCIFRGMQSYNAESIKSLEGFDVAYVEEAQSLSDVSLRMLRPTLRKDGSELWFAWNPRHDDDAIDKFLRGPHRPKDAIVVEINWQDNPWFPATLRDEKDTDYAADAEMAEHVWGGGYLIVSEGAYYARALLQAERDGRFGDFPFTPGVPVATSWDIGVDDYSAVWFFQYDGLKARAIDYYEASGEGADDIMATALPELFIRPDNNSKWMEWTLDDSLYNLDRMEPFTYSQHWLPHDVKFREWGAGARSRIEALQSFGLKNMLKGVPVNPSDRIAAVRKLLPVIYFNNKNPRVAMGLKRLQRYRRKFNDSLNTYMAPERDENTHGADAFGEFCINVGIHPPKPKPAPAKVSTKLPTLSEIVAEHDRNQRFLGNRI